jgi:transposase-like protein
VSARRRDGRPPRTPRHRRAAAVGAPPGQEKTPQNRRHGQSKKTVQGERGDIPLDSAPDRQGTFDPVLIGKYQRRLAGKGDQMLAWYAKGLTTRAIQEVVGQL